MNIRMYNCYFGDCFCINNSNGNDLMVDCGIHKSCTKANVRTKRFNDIYCDISARDIDFLLSHYHEDHYNGAVYIIQNYKYKFKDIYIPDIWSFNGCINAINLHLLRGILDKSYLNSSMSIFDFLKSICDTHKVIHFVRRGTAIQDKYIALWPSEEYIKLKALEAYKNTIDKTKLDDNAVEQLEQFAGKLQRIVLDMYSRDYTGAVLLQRLDVLEEDFRRFVNEINLTDDNRSIIIDLRHFENDISIVFQNNEKSSSENIIFTGDFGSNGKLWNYIENNNDNNPACYMHDCYHAIKVGHHGTRSYYHSFIGRMNNDSIVLIPNDGKSKNWNICSDYSLNVVTAGAKSICSTDNACEAKNNNKGKCTCLNYTIIEPVTCTDII